MNVRRHSKIINRQLTSDSRLDRLERAVALLITNMEVSARNWLEQEEINNIVKDELHELGKHHKLSAKDLSTELSEYYQTSILNRQNSLEERVEEQLEKLQADVEVLVEILEAEV